MSDLEEALGLRGVKSIIVSLTSYSLFGEFSSEMGVYKTTYSKKSKRILYKKRPIT